MMTPLTKDELREIAILVLAEEIARQTRPESALAVAATPHEIARALYLLGWDPPAGYGLRADSVVKKYKPFVERESSGQ